jgi:hypothetical protein
MRLRARAGKPLWVSQAIVGTALVVASLRAGDADYPSPWARGGAWNWVLADARLFEEPIRGIKGRPGIFKAEIHAT